MNCCLVYVVGYWQAFKVRLAMLVQLCWRFRCIISCMISQWWNCILQQKAFHVQVVCHYSTTVYERIICRYPTALCWVNLLSVRCRVCIHMHDEPEKNHWSEQKGRCMYLRHLLYYMYFYVAWWSWAQFFSVASMKDLLLHALLCRNCLIPTAFSNFCNYVIKLNRTAVSKVSITML